AVVRSRAGGPALVAQKCCGVPHPTLCVAHLAPALAPRGASIGAKWHLSCLLGMMVLPSEREPDRRDCPLGGPIMARILAGFSVLLPVMRALGDEAKAKNKPKTPAEQVQALIEEYEDAYRAYAKARKEAKTFEERDRIRKELYPEADRFAPRFFALAEKHAKDPAAVD